LSIIEAIGLLDPSFFLIKSLSRMITTFSLEVKANSATWLTILSDAFMMFMCRLKIVILWVLRYKSLSRKTK